MKSILWFKKRIDLSCLMVRGKLNKNKNTKKTSEKSEVFLILMDECYPDVCDLDRIQTCNLLSRNQMRYSVAPRGL